MSSDSGISWDFKHNRAFVEEPVISQSDDEVFNQDRAMMQNVTRPFLSDLMADPEFAERWRTFPAVTVSDKLFRMVKS